MTALCHTSQKDVETMSQLLLYLSHFVMMEDGSGTELSIRFITIRVLVLSLSL
jgi:hypothetical protein